MAPLALALQLALASPGLAPPPELHPGPLQGSTLALASAGTLAGDALVFGAGYLTLQLFASGAISPTATNFRRAAYGMLAAATLVPPLTAVLLGRLGRGGRDGVVWRALVLAAAGQVATFAVGWAAAPHYWVMLPVQLAALSLATSVGLHWGRRRPHADARPAPDRPPGEPPGDDAVALFVPVCRDAG
jgi:hypothetical protein